MKLPKQKWERWGVWWNIVMFGITGFAFILSFVSIISSIIDEAFPLIDIITNYSFYLIVLILVALLLIFVSYGLMEHALWAWYIALIFWVATILLAIISSPSWTSVIISMILPIFSLYALMNKKTAKLFGVF